MKKVIYPFSFDNGICPHCGSNSIKYLDKYDKITIPDIYPVDKMICNNCNKEFLINWNKHDDEDYTASPNSYNLIEVFEEDIVKFSKDNKRDIALENYTKYNQLLKPVNNIHKEEV